MKALLVPAACCLASLPLAGTTLLFDFGNTASPTNPNWNNVVPATTTLFAVIDTNGNVAGATGFEITDQFFQSGEPSQLGTESPMGDAAGYPVSATDDYFFGHTTPFAGAASNPLGEFRLYNLLSDTAYSFTFFTSRTGVTDNREALYTVIGATTDSVTLNASNNDSEVARVLSIFPDVNNEIHIQASPGPNNDNANGFYYIGLLQVDFQEVPEPSVVLLLGGALIYSLRRRRP